MLIQDLDNAGAIPTLGKMLQFAAQRQKILVHNIANMDTPDFRPLNLSVKDFQKTLAHAIQERRNATGGQTGELPLEGTREVANAPDGTLLVHPKTASGNILYHDRNNRDLERMMQDLAENELSYRVTTNLMRQQTDTLKMAISQRV